MSAPLKNPDRDRDHKRRREAGSDDNDPNGQEMARKLYGGLKTEYDADDAGRSGDSGRMDDRSDSQLRLWTDA